MPRQAWIALLLVTPLVGWPAHPAGASEPFVLAESTPLRVPPPQTMLVLRADAGYQERLAAGDFVDYVHRAHAGKTLLPQAWGSAPDGWAGSVIELGVAGRPPFEDVDPTAMPMHGFHIRTEPDRLVIIGASEQGASNALYWLLREKIGVRWYMPTRLGEEVPIHEQIVIEAMDETLAPDIPMVSAQVDSRFYGTNGNRTPKGESRDTMARHIWDQIVVPSEQNKREHPEWFALTDRKELPTEDWMLEFLWKDGDGAIRSNQVCTTNPEVLKLFVVHISQYFRENPDVQMHSVEPNDYAEFCTCPRCKALDKKLDNGPLANRLVYFFNQIAAQTKDEFPDKYLGFYAYHKHVDPPTVVKPNPQLWAALCFFGGRACYQHAIDDPSCPTNRAWKAAVFDGWAVRLDTFGYYSYYGNSGRWAGPQVLTRHIARDLRLMHSKGCTWFHVDHDRWTSLSWATNAPMLYLIRRLPWDVDADPEAILDEWYRGTYGPAQKPMKRYWQTLIEARYKVPHAGSNLTSQDISQMFTPEVLARAAGYLSEAEQVAAAADDRYRRRVAIARAGLAFTDPMAQAHALAVEGKYAEAVEAGRRALRVIVETRDIEPEPYYRPGEPTEPFGWAWFRTSDGRGAERSTLEVIEAWEKKASN